MKKRFVLLFVFALILLSFTSCEYYTTSANKLFTYRGEVADPVNTTPYENFEVLQQLAIRDDHVCVMFAKSLTIDDDTVKYVGLDGGEGDGAKGHILLVASNGGNTLNWPTPSPDVTVQCQILGSFAGVPVWGVIIPKSNFKNVGEDAPDLLFSWKFVWGDGWDGNEQTGVAPFVLGQFNNCAAKLNAANYTDAANF